MAIKVSDLEKTIDGLTIQVQKIWDEQRKRYEDLLVQFNELKDELDNAEIPEVANEKLIAFQDKLNKFDEEIPSNDA